MSVIYSFKEVKYFNMFQRFINVCLSPNIQTRYQSILSKAKIKERKNLLFNEEKKRQRAAVGRIEKIEVKYQSPVEEVTLVMNKCISTPADCAKHISEGVSKVSALALVNGSPWDMHEPLTSNCELKFLNLLSPENRVVNSAFWRTCSFLLGAVVDSSFKSDIKVYLHSFPVPVIRSGSFIYDVYLEFPEWKPTDEEMRALSAEYVKLTNKELDIERMVTTESVAAEIFCDNPFKSEQLSDIAKSNDNKVTLYRVGDHIDISKGPMVGNTSLIGRCTIAAVHKLPNKENLYRFQGIALPKGIRLNQFAYGILEKRAKKINTVTLSYLSNEIEAEDISEISANEV